jgi:N-acetylglucosamine kinase-like BadF-type ATPase
MSASAFAGIDGGGTKTAIVVVDESGNEIFRTRTTTSNAAVVGHEVAGATLRTAIEEVNRALPSGTTLRAAWFGLSGSDRPEDQARLRPFVQDLAPSIRMSNDARLVLTALPGGFGVAAVSGTGSIAYGQNSRGEFTRAGGWGHVFSDEGSGYDLARRMFDAFARDVDGRGPKTALTARLTEELQLAEPFRLIAWVYAPTTAKGDIAKLARIVIEECDAGDPVATDIVRRSASELAGMVAAVARRLGFTSPLPLAVTGGTLVHAQQFREAVLAVVRKEFDEIDLRVVDDPARTAAQALASEYREAMVKA